MADRRLHLNDVQVNERYRECILCGTCADNCVQGAIRSSFEGMIKDAVKGRRAPRPLDLTAARYRCRILFVILNVMRLGRWMP